LTRYALVLAFIVLLVGCGAEGSGGPLTSQPPLSTPQTTAPADSTTLRQEETLPESNDPDENFLVAQAIADLVARMDADPTEIKVESVETGIWNDGSVGCPETGVAYIQALIPGTRVSLRLDDITYAYHQGGSDAPFLCESPVEDAFEGVEGDILIPPPGYDE